MEIKGFIDVSLVDWDGKVSSVIFLPGCNMRCPFCYNTALVLHSEKMPTIPFEEIEGHLRRNRDWIDGVVITGGEPTIHNDLPSLCGKIKELGLGVKVDTNGTDPTMIKGLIQKGLVNYIAMDIKAPLTREKYSKACGVNATNLLEKIGETIDFLLEGEVEYEFKTTVVRTLHKRQDIEEISHRIKGCQKYVIQNFKTNVETISPKFKKLKPFSEKTMKTFHNTAKKD